MKKLIPPILYLASLVMLISYATSCVSQKQLTNKYIQKVHCYEFTN